MSKLITPIETRQIALDIMERIRVSTDSSKKDIYLAKVHNSDKKQLLEVLEITTDRITYLTTIANIKADELVDLLIQEQFVQRLDCDRELLELNRLTNQYKDFEFNFNNYSSLYEIKCWSTDL